MNTRTMEGLVGASTNMEMINTPMRVYKEARRRGDTATMERAMGYVAEFADRAEEYKTEAYEGMEEDAKEAREKAETEREEAIQRRREEREKLEEKIDENKDADTNTDTIEISEEGKVLLKENTNLDNTNSNDIKQEAVKESAVYTKTGEVIQIKQSTGISVSI